jgi:hypothetical protein
MPRLAGTLRFSGSFVRRRGRRRADGDARRGRRLHFLTIIPAPLSDDRARALGPGGVRAGGPRVRRRPHCRSCPFQTRRRPSRRWTWSIVLGRGSPDARRLPGTLSGQPVPLVRIGGHPFSARQPIPICCEYDRAARLADHRSVGSQKAQPSWPTLRAFTSYESALAVRLSLRVRSQRHRQGRK